MKALPDLSSLSHEQKDELIRTLFEMVQRLTARVEELEARLSKDSHNSSKPPSSDGLGKKPHSLRELSGKHSGGQSGHLGKTLKRASHADIVIDHPLAQRCACGAALDAAQARIHERRQVFDIPVARYQVTEQRTRQLRCTCGMVHQSAFPEGVTEVVQYGPNVRALAVHLTHGQLLPLARSVQLISQLFALELSQASVLAWIDEASHRLHPAVEHSAQALVNVPVAHADESGLRVAACLHWLHTVASETLTWYGVHANAAWRPSRHTASCVAASRCWCMVEAVLGSGLRARPVQCALAARTDLCARDHRPRLGQTHDGTAAARQPALRNSTA